MSKKKHKEKKAVSKDRLVYDGVNPVVPWALVPEPVRIPDIKRIVRFLLPFRLPADRTSTAYNKQLRKVERDVHDQLHPGDGGCPEIRRPEAG